MTRTTVDDDDDYGTDDDEAERAMSQSASWAIDSWPMRARGIIVLVKSN